MAKYYLCEGNADKGLQKVTPYNEPGKALDAAKDSKFKVHFISTVNPFEDDERG